LTKLLIIQRRIVNRSIHKV